MTTSTYRDGKGPSASDSYFHVTSLARRLARSWHKWQTAREIESMPFDIRKDVGWPSADNSDERKVM